MDDDYVAEVLAREARDSSQRYQTDGLGAYMPRRFVFSGSSLSNVPTN
jgi:hypothetical protein